MGGKVRKRYYSSGTNNCEKGTVHLQGFLHTHTQQGLRLPSFSLDAISQSCKVRIGEWRVGVVGAFSVYTHAQTVPGVEGWGGGAFSVYTRAQTVPEEHWSLRGKKATQIIQARGLGGVLGLNNFW